MSMSQVAAASVDLYWLPLGAGDNTHCVRTNGRIFEPSPRATSGGPAATYTMPHSRWAWATTGS
jgi:hypothetical protein